MKIRKFWIKNFKPRTTRLWIATRVSWLSGIKNWMQRRRKLRVYLSFRQLIWKVLAMKVSLECLFSFSPLFAFLRFRERNIGTRVSKLDGFLKREGARCIVFKRGVEDGWKEEFRRIGCSLFSCFRSFPSDRNSSWLIRCLLSVFPVCGGGTRKLNEGSIFLRLPITLHFFWDVLAARIADFLKILFNLILENYKYYRNEHNSNKIGINLVETELKNRPCSYFHFYRRKILKISFFFLSYKFKTHRNLKEFAKNKIQPGETRDPRATITSV